MMPRSVMPFSADTSHRNSFGNQDSIQVAVHIHADVMAPALAQHKANAWLSMHAGHLLLAENPELLLMTPLQWRFDIILTVPQRAKPGTVAHTWIGRLHLDAVTGAVIDPETLLQELTSHVDALTGRAA
ncbi:MAG: hypothetical protein WAU00_11225 [Caldilinea sp.]|uniref:hypothetical protein n=1 Tax=Caldilinea sp. TaxID=2293560 RepID=UPI002BACC36F|nr:hypothetical protein [Anaerolineales bacterium]HQY91894.1 hypothetical protein [Caldilinea sp.]